MRITEKLSFQSAVANAQLARQNLDIATTQLSSGKSIEHPSDNPAAAGLLVIAQANAARFDAIGTSLGRANDEINAANGALGDVQQQLVRTRELAVQMANGTYSANDRAGAAVEIDGIIAGMTSAMNTQVGTRYIFGGNKDGSPPFDSTGAYQGDAGVRKVEIAPGVLEPSSVRADVALKGVGGGSDVFATLQSLSAALKSNDPNAVAGALPQLDLATQQVSRALSDVGASQNVFDTATAANATLRDGEKAQASHLGDVDVIDATTRMTMANTALNAALTATAHSFSMSLVDKL